MSHQETVVCQLTDLGALAAAIMELAPGSTIEMASPQKAVTCNEYYKKSHPDGVIRMPNREYDIGIDRQADGSYALRTDFLDGKAAIVGQNFEKLLQYTAIHRATVLAQNQGLQVARQWNGQECNLVCMGARL